MNYDDILAEQEYLEHWGILGMKWGVRRYQNKDGSLTQAGRARYGSGSSKSLGERYSAYKKARTAKIKEKTIRSGDIKTILKNKKYLTDTEFDKAVARAKKVKELKAETAKPKKEESEYSKKIKESITDSLTRKRDWKTPSTQEARDYDIAKSKIEAEKAVKDNGKQKTSGITLDKIQKGAKTAAKIWATYTAVAKVVNAVSGDDKKLPTKPSDIAEKLLGKKTKDDEPKYYTTFDPSKKASQDFTNIANYISKQQSKPTTNNSSWVATGSNWFSSDSGKAATNTPLNNLPKNKKKAKSIIDNYSDMALDIFEEMYGK